MKRIVLTLIIAIAFFASSHAQISVGVRDNRHIFCEYLLKNNYLFKLEESVYAESFGFQTLRADVAYTSTVSNLQYSGGLYFGSAYNGSYFITGANINLRLTLFKRLLLMGGLNPHYDSQVKYKTCYAAGAGVRITKNIDFSVAYTTIPEYRMSENRVKGGFRFSVSKLEVEPQLSISVKGNDRFKTLRALMSFKYTFGKKKAVSPTESK